MGKISRFLVILLFLISVCHAYFQSGFPYTHDGENHLARFANYKIALKEGQFPPRFAPNLLNHYGYPVFNYNYPLANILSLPFSMVKINYETTFKLLVFLSLGFGSYGVFLFLQNVGFDKKPSLITAVTWLTLPYLISLINFRGSIGEILAYALLPWTLWTIEKGREARFFLEYFFISVIILSAYLLSHNVTVIFSIPILLIFLVVQYKKRFQFYKNWFFSLLAAVGLTLWFWLPALAEMGEVIVGQSSSNNDFTKHFVTIGQLLFSPVQFGFSYPGYIDSLSFQVGAVVVISLFIFTSILLAQVKRKSWSAIPQIVYLSFAITCALLFLEMPASTPVWQLFNFAKFIQFPWRLTIFVAFFSLPLVAYIVDFLWNRWRLAIYILLVFVVWQTLSTKPVDFFHKSMVDYDAFSQTTSTQNENLPRTFQYSEISTWQPGPQLTPQSAQPPQVTIWSGSKHIYSITVAEPTTVVEPTAYFLGWQTNIQQNNQMIETIPYDLTGAQGLIAYHLNPGSYEITTQFTQKTPARMIGNTISIVTFLACIIFFFWQKRLSRYEKK